MWSWEDAGFPMVLLSVYLWMAGGKGARCQPQAPTSRAQSMPSVHTPAHPHLSPGRPEDAGWERSAWPTDQGRGWSGDCRKPPTIPALPGVAPHHGFPVCDKELTRATVAILGSTGYLPGAAPGCSIPGVSPGGREAAGGDTW